MVLLFLCSCKNKSTNVSTNYKYIDTDTVVYDEIEKLYENDNNYIWYRYKVGGKVGALDKNKNVLIEAQYDFLYFDDDIEMFIGKIGENVEVIKENGIVFVPISRNYELFSKEDLGNGDNRYYYEVVRKGLYGICDKNGNEVIVPKFSYLNYEDKYDDARFHDDATNPIGLYGSFYTKDNNENVYIFDIYIDGNGKCSKLNGKRWTRLYSSSEVMRMEDASCFTSKNKSIFRSYGSFIMNGYEKYHIINDYTEGNNTSLLAQIVNIDGGGYEVDEDIHTFINHKYMTEWKKVKDISISDFYGNPQTKKTNNSYSVQQNTLPSNYAPNTPNERTTGQNRYACRSCRNQGRCLVCNGTGQTHTKRVYNYSLGCYDLDYETCRSCRGSGSCTACKGDGWLDEGIDY